MLLNVRHNRTTRANQNSNLTMSLINSITNNRSTQSTNHNHTTFRTTLSPSMTILRLRLTFRRTNIQHITSNSRRTISHRVTLNTILNTNRPRTNSTKVVTRRLISSIIPRSLSLTLTLTYRRLILRSLLNLRTITTISGNSLTTSINGMRHLLSHNITTTSRNRILITMRRTITNHTNKSPTTTRTNLKLSTRMLNTNTNNSRRHITNMLTLITLRTRKTLQRVNLSSIIRSRLHIGTLNITTRPIRRIKPLRTLSIPKPIISINNHRRLTTLFRTNRRRQLRINTNNMSHNHMTNQTQTRSRRTNILHRMGSKHFTKQPSTKPTDVKPTPPQFGHSTQSTHHSASHSEPSDPKETRQVHVNIPHRAGALRNHITLIPTTYTSLITHNRRI